jgi:uncharacterized membrane protein
VGSHIAEIAPSCPSAPENAFVSAFIGRRYAAVIHPLHAVVLAGSVPLFLGAALSDAAYVATYQVQWSNFASWLLVGGLICSGIALLFLAIDLFRASRRAPGILAYAIVLLATWVLGFIDALVHARDAWAGMPAGLVLSVIVTLLGCAGTWFGFRGRRPGVPA